MELIKKQNTVTKENGEVKHYTNFYLLFENGNYVAIKPAFQGDYKVLVVMATPEKGGD
jgi:hypothetical protein